MRFAAVPCAALLFDVCLGVYVMYATARGYLWSIKRVGGKARQTPHGDLARSRQQYSAATATPARLSLHYIIHRVPSAAPVSPQAK